MFVGTHQRTAEADNLVIEISNMHFERVSKFKYLGVFLDNTLSWKDKIDVPHAHVLLNVLLGKSLIGEEKEDRCATFTCLSGLKC